MKKIKILLLFLCANFFVHSSQAELLQQFELENGSLLAGYSSTIHSPFNGAAAYANGDGVETVAHFSNIPGVFRVDIRGASSNDNTAGISVYLGDRRMGAASFNGSTPSVQSVEFTLESSPESTDLRFVLETDNGSSNTYLDWFELHRVGDIPPPPPPPVLPSEGAYDSGVYRNLFVEMGLSQAEVDARVEEVYEQLFHSPDQEDEAIFIPVGDDMAYIWDVGNNDVRSEGMSYGMMMAVQMDRKEDFDRLWKWAHTYSLNTSGDMTGYFAWEVTTDGQVRDRNPAPDGEAYFATALFFASHLWGDGDGIFNYSEQANSILNDMYSNGQTRYNNQGELETFSLFDHETRLIVFSPATPTDRNWTDPSYHLPAYFDLWAKWADNHNEFWAEAAEASRAFLQTTVHPETGLNPDYAYFDGRPHGDFQYWKDTFQYDAWRTVSNAAIDYAWFQKDPWQITYAETLQAFFDSEGIGAYSSLYELDGTPYEGNSDHSAGLVAMNAVASLASEDPRAWKFVQALWDRPVPTGQWRYYDGSLYMFAMLRASGNYRIICPDGECDHVEPPSCEVTNSCPSDQPPVEEEDDDSSGDGNGAEQGGDDDDANESDGASDGDDASDDSDGSQDAGSGSNVLILRAVGTSGNEQVRVNIGGQPRVTWELSSSWQEYTLNTDATGDINVELINDQGEGYEAQLDYLEANGDRRYAEDQSYNTTAWDGHCGGGSFTHWMHCNGMIGFGELPETNTGGDESSNDDANNDDNTSNDDPDTGNDDTGDGTGDTATGGDCQCNWYGSLYPSCDNQSSGWGWENSQSCIGDNTCNDQWGDGGVVCN